MPGPRRSRGAGGIVASNHGGRQLYEVPSGIRAQPPIADAVGDNKLAWPAAERGRGSTAVARSLVTYFLTRCVTTESRSAISLQV